MGTREELGLQPEGPAPRNVKEVLARREVCIIAEWKQRQSQTHATIRVQLPLGPQCLLSQAQTRVNHSWHSTW